MENLNEYLQAFRDGFNKMIELGVESSEIYTVGVRGALNPPGEDRVISTKNVKISRVIIKGKGCIKLECCEAGETIFLPAGTEGDMQKGLEWLDHNTNLPDARHMRKIFIPAKCIDF